jgi:hypothetical protein
MSGVSLKFHWDKKAPRHEQVAAIEAQLRALANGICVALASEGLLDIEDVPREVEILMEQLVPMIEQADEALKADVPERAEGTIH